MVNSIVEFFVCHRGLGLHKLPFKWRTLTTESTAVLMPFNVMDIQDVDGIYYGVNTVSKNLILADRRKLLNANGFVLGVSGSGKSFKVKEEIVNLILRGDADILCVDPEREYGDLFHAVGGEVIHISAGSNNHINAMAMNKNYGDDENPIILKSEFILSLVEQLVGAGKLNAKEKSIIDRCTANVFRSYIANGFEGEPPTLKEFRQELLRQDEPEAREVALAIELFTDGSLNTFAQQTNVNVDSQYVVYDIKDLGKQLRTIGMLVVLDNIFNRITENRAKGRHTFVIVDEIYLMFQNEYSSNFLFELWKRVRKYGAKNGNVHYYFRCSTNKQLGSTACKSHMIPEKALTDILLASINSIIDNFVDIEKAIQKNENNQLLLMKKRVKHKLDKAIQERERLANTRTQLYHSYINGLEEMLTDEVYIDMKNNYENLNKENNDKILSFKMELDKLDNNKNYKTKFMQEYGEYKGLDLLTREIVAGLVNKVIVGEDKSVKILFNFQDEIEKYAQFID